MKGAIFNVRMKQEDLDGFHARAKELRMEPADLAREVLLATTEQRITLVPSKDQRKAHAELYKL